MFSLWRPTDRAIDRFLRQSQHLPLSYSAVGTASERVRGYTYDESTTIIGHGRADYERARTALRSWRQFDIGWAEVFPRNAAPEVGTVVAVLIRHFGFWSVNGCRVLYHVGADSGTQYEFAYGTLTNHAESGEELFEVDLDPESGNVRYRIRAASRPNALVARVAFPIARLLQARFRRCSAAAMAHACADLKNLSPLR